MTIDEELGQNYVLDNGVLRCTVAQPHVFYKEDPARVLALLTAAAAKGCTIDLDTYAAAQSAFSGLSRLPVAVIREAAQNILLSDTPEALDPILASGALGIYGLTSSGKCLRQLRDVPCTMETRWWVLMRLCRAQYALVCERLGFSKEFANTLAGMDRLAATTNLPKTVQELKTLLGRLPEFDYEATVKTLLSMDSRWEGQLELYDQLCALREPYRLNHLAISTADLASQGITGPQAAWVFHGLLDAAIKAPGINTWPILMSLAKTLAEQYR